MNTLKLVLSIIVSSVVLFSAALVLAAPLDKIQFIKVSSQDSKAVIKSIDGKVQVIKPGDTVVENVTVKEIVSGRIILEEKTSDGLETLIVRVYGGKTRTERQRKQPGKDAPATPQK